MPREVLKLKKALVGKEQALQMIEDLPVKYKEVLVVCLDTAVVNSVTGKVGGACFWYQELSEAVCFVVMCRLHSLECLAGMALTEWNVAIIGSTPKCEFGPSGNSLLQPSRALIETF